MARASILGSGLYLPIRSVENAEVEEKLSLKAGFIESKTGIIKRRWADDSFETADYMAGEAAISAIVNARLGEKRIDAILTVRDSTRVDRASSLALPMLKRLRGTEYEPKDTFNLDLGNNCAGFTYALNIAHLMVKANQVENVLVVTSTNFNGLRNLDKSFNGSFQKGFNKNDPQILQFSSRVENYQAPALNAFLWGDGAGAVVVGKSEKDNVLGFKARSSREVLYDSMGMGVTNKGDGFLVLDGPVIYQYAMREIPSVINDLLVDEGMQLKDVDHIISHQPNPRMLKMLEERLGEDAKGKIPMTCDILGNCIAASVPITYHIAKEQGKILPGNRNVMCSFGDSYLTTACLLFAEAER